MRRFWLKKGSTVWDLSSGDLSLSAANFMATPAGLGVKVKVDSYEVERATFIENVKLESAEISGKLYFNDYAQFTAFAGFIGYVETTEPLRLYYSTAEEKPDYNSIDEWYRLVLIKELKKGEIDLKSGKLICDIKFQAVSRWKKDRLITLELSPFGTPLVYPYIYPYIYGGQNNVGVYIDNIGGLPTHCTVRIEAETDMPLFRIIRNGSVIDQARYNVYIRPGSHMIINSDPANQEASLYKEKKQNERKKCC
ncbi:MAG: hypothetical protein FWD58_08865 [Firmicutes bacterium]|nr:hypothetical protein [Bacillota bacterium]